MWLSEGFPPAIFDDAFHFVGDFREFFFSVCLFTPIGVAAFGFNLYLLKPGDFIPKAGFNNDGVDEEILVLGLPQ